MKDYFTIEQLAVRSMKGYFVSTGENSISSGKAVDIYPTEVSALIQKDAAQKAEIEKLKHDLQRAKDDRDNLFDAIRELPKSLDIKAMEKFKANWIEEENNGN